MTTIMMMVVMGLPLQGHNPEDDYDKDDGGDGLAPKRATTQMMGLCVKQPQPR